MTQWNKPVFCRCNPEIRMLAAQPAVSSLVESIALAGCRSAVATTLIAVPSANTSSGFAEQFVVQSWQVAPEAWVFRVWRNTKFGRRWMSPWTGRVPASGVVARNWKGKPTPQVVCLGLAMDAAAALRTARSFVKTACKMEKRATDSSKENS